MEDKTRKSLGCLFLLVWFVVGIWLFDNAIIEALFMTVVAGLIGVGTYRRVKRKRKYYDVDDDGKDA